MSIFELLASRIRAEQPVALATIVAGPNVGAKLLVVPDAAPLGTLGDPDLDRVVARDTLAELEAARTGVRHYGPHGETTPEDLVDSPVVGVFVESHAPPPQMWIFGAVDFTAALAKVAKVLGYRVTVCDAREVFATRRRFPMADEVLVSWPSPVFEERGRHLGARDAVCVLTHDPKFDVPAVRRRARDERRLHRRDGQPHHPRQAARPPGRGRRHRSRRARPADVTDRPRHRRPHTRGDGDLDRAPRSSRCAPAAPRRRCGTARGTFTSAAPTGRRGTARVRALCLQQAGNDC